MTDMLSESEKSIKSLKKDLAEAVARQDPVGYARASDGFGGIPDFPQLSELGWLEIECENETRNFFLDSDSKAEDLDSKLEKYKNFYKKGKFLNARDFQKDAVLKAELLEKYFPGRFGEKGKQPLLRLDDIQVGALFKKIMEYAEKRTNQ